MNGLRMPARGTLAGIFSVVIASAAVAGPEWPETMDAGPLPGSAGVTTGVGPLSGIKGELTGAARGARGDGDFQDMYAIQIADPATFAAFVVPNGGGSPTFDTLLWLFDANGVGVLANDDSPTSGPGLSGFGRESTDMTASRVETPGLYYLAISGSPSVPLDGGGTPIFVLDSSTEVSGPDGSSNAVAAWSGPGQTGEYEIQLNGATFADQRQVEDLDSSGCVGSGALGSLLAAWGPCVAGQPCVSDLDGDGQVGSGDLGILLAAWGNCVMKR